MGPPAGIEFALTTLVYHHPSPGHNLIDYPQRRLSSHTLPSHPAAPTLQPQHRQHALYTHPSRRPTLQPHTSHSAIRQSMPPTPTASHCTSVCFGSRLGSSNSASDRRTWLGHSWQFLGIGVGIVTDICHNRSMFLAGQPTHTLPGRYWIPQPFMSAHGAHFTASLHL
ncbi:hypothetical protein Pst134EA_027895 [Puccinia striiformis f. sp. tritici]|uniref:hypothetical protein n=1 Tax=Puccinia striiformis f. sp. tritici TaxID=168172 RepID=UPI002008A572|nr:hypothetical protein Pst134EA_027895 [Puccinia striiformis f. sp. tritici]KAH9448585.1 hypothetical protein Pst134EA_027895 [Puccinia striiformis f. sp. tritici]